MLKELKGWTVVESMPITGMEPRILAMVAPWKGIILLQVVGSGGEIVEISLDRERMTDLQSAMSKAMLQSIKIEQLKEKLSKEGLCEHGWTKGNCDDENCVNGGNQ